MPSSNEKQWQAMLKRLAERDGSVELSRGVSNDQAAVITYRSRAFEVLEDGCIIVETPRQAVQDKSFKVGHDIDLTIMVNNERMVATCTLHEAITYEVNPSLRVTCYRLSPGRRPVREQRRSFYRVSVAAMDLKPVKLSCKIDEDEVFECAGKLSNISAGGFGVSIRATREVLGQIKRTRFFECSAWLSDQECVVAPVRVMHINALGDDGLYLGLQFAFTDETEADQLEQHIQQRCTEIQRMQLQRRRA
ncbi:MAG: PilZ domain-containing protein [Phycisphaeraceae bacterium]|nr:PilZ domain-containing protein [Phycisphaeraceae bacterium]